jgi:hypothetical protein
MNNTDLDNKSLWLQKEIFEHFKKNKRVLLNLTKLVSIGIAVVIFINSYKDLNAGYDQLNHRESVLLFIGILAGICNVIFFRFWNKWFFADIESLIFSSIIWMILSFINTLIFLVILIIRNRELSFVNELILALSLTCLSLSADIIIVRHYLFKF